jgi:hypothetical protein
MWIFTDTIQFLVYLGFFNQNFEYILNPNKIEFQANLFHLVQIKEIYGIPLPWDWEPIPEGQAPHYSIG